MQATSSPIPRIQIYGLGPLPLSLVTELAWLLGQISWSVYMGGFRLVDWDEIQETKTKMAPH